MQNRYVNPLSRGAMGGPPQRHPTEAEKSGTKRLPITVEDLNTFHQLLQPHATANHDNVMLWAAIYLAYFGFLRVTEAPGKEGKGGGRPSNVLQDHFSNSSNPGVKITREGGGKAGDFGSSNVYECRCVYQSSAL